MNRNVLLDFQAGGRGISSSSFFSTVIGDKITP